VIFSGAPADANDERAVLDDKSARSAALWLRLANEFVNNPAWKPQNTFGAIEPLIAAIDPSKVPVRNIRGDELRAQFSKYRSNYTVAYFNFKKSGKNVEDANHLAGDDEFKTDYCRNDSVTVYQRHLYSRDDVPKFVKKDLPANCEIEEGFLRSSTTVVTTPAAGGKRQLNPQSATTNELLAAMLASNEKITATSAKQVSLQEEMNRDKMLTNKKMRINSDMEMLKNIANAENINRNIREAAEEKLMAYITSSSTTLFE
jgi:hypothetical protein